MIDSLSKTLHPYKDIIGSTAGYLTIAQFFSGFFICRDIYRKGSTRNVDSSPFVGGIMVAFAMLKYGFVLQDEVTLKVNFVAITLNAVYCIFYYLYSTDKWNEILKPFALWAVFVAVLWAYCEMEDPSLLEFRYGLIVTVIMLFLLGKPLLGINEIIKNKDASQIPFVLTLMAALVTFSWLLYGLILKNTFMLVQNVVGFTLCFVQLILMFLYPGKPSQPTKKKKQ